MRVLAIDHVNISGPADVIERCRAFYVDVLRLVDGHRPAFRTRGHWLYAADHPLIHLTVRDDVRGTDATHVDHVALACEGLNETLAALDQHGVTYTIDRVPSGAAQLFLRDPAGVPIELNFAAISSAP